MKDLRGLSLNQPYAWFVRAGIKTIETRKTRIRYRGDVVICSTKKFDETALIPPELELLPEEVLYGVTMALVSIVDCRPLLKTDYESALFFAPDRWAWMLENIRPLKPHPVRGMQGLFPFPEDVPIEFK